MNKLTRSEFEVSDKASLSASEERPISTVQVSVLPQQYRNIFVDNRITYDLLKKIACSRDKFDAIDTIVNETPDGKQALNVYLRLANQGINIELKSATTGRVVKRYDAELREFCKNIGKNNSCGLDGLVDQLHNSAVTRTGMAVEVVVNDDATDIDEVLIIDPATITEFKWLPEKNRYAAYQSGFANGKKVDLYDGNFFWVPHQPKPGSPVGTMQFEPAIATETEFYQLIQDSMAVLNRIGYPRYKCEIDRAALLESATPAQKATGEAQAKLFEDTFNQVEHQLIKMGKENDLITFDSNKVDILGGGVNGSGIDVRAWFEVLEPLICNSFQLTPVLMGRLKSGSYSLGTAEYSIVCDTIDTMRRASKRILEEIVNLWARVRGYNVRATVTHNPIDWQTELDKLSVELKRMEKARRAEEYQWVTHDEAAQIGLDKDKASAPAQLNVLEYLTHNKEAEVTNEESEQEEQNNPNQNGGDTK
jgi:hypothetical protein